MFNPFKLFPVFSCFVVFIIWFNFASRRSLNRDRKKEKAFWDREEKANATRKKELHSLKFIHIPIADLPFGITSDEQIISYEKRIKALSEQKIVNLTGITNTDLKLKYGAPNLTLLTEYDTNFIQFVSVMNQWATRLYKSGFPSEALILLECAIHNGSDIKGSYVLLCQLYDELGFGSKKAALLPYAESLNSLMKEPILKYLTEEA